MADSTWPMVEQLKGKSFFRHGPRNVWIGEYESHKMHRTGSLMREGAVGAVGAAGAMSGAGAVVVVVVGEAGEEEKARPCFTTCWLETFSSVQSTPEKMGGNRRWPWWFLSTSGLRRRGKIGP